MSREERFLDALLRLPWGTDCRPRERALTEGEWIVRLCEAFGALAAEHRQQAGAGLDAAIDRLIRLLCQWRSERAS